MMVSVSQFDKEEALLSYLYYADLTSQLGILEGDPGLSPRGISLSGQTDERRKVQVVSWCGATNGCWS